MRLSGYKTWDFHVTTALNIELDENLRMITESVAAASVAMNSFDCEHYFDGYKAIQIMLLLRTGSSSGWSILVIL